MATLFFSYSHRDEVLRDELEIHLTSLKRRGVIETWHDRRINAGDDFGREISEHLEVADVILLLVSPYFIASNYCFEIEMARALERHNAKTARVIPVILEPCDWHELPFGRLLATPKDGKPVSKFANLHDAFLEIVQAIAAAVKSDAGQRQRSAPQKSESFSQAQSARPDVRSSNLRIKKEFTDHDRDVYLEESFEYISRFFQGSLEELQKRNPEITSRFKKSDASRFTAHIYRNGESLAQCAVAVQSNFGSSITYSGDASSTNGYNEAIRVKDDGHALFLEAMGFASLTDSSDRQLSQNGAAELFWEILVRRLQH